MNKAATLVLGIALGSAVVGHAATIKKQPFGTLNGTTVDIYTLVNDGGAEMSVTSYGGIVTALKVPDKDGTLGDVVLGFNTLDGYLNEAYMKSKPYFGAIVGRYSDRIHGGKFSLEGRTFTLSQNEGKNTLHGGAVGFNSVVWAVKSLETKDGPALDLTYTSPDGDQGFPGNLTMTVRYTLTNDNALRVDYRATTDTPTVINMTHHSYFNLGGEGSGTNVGHEVMINADKFAANLHEGGFIASGELLPVAGTPLDFRQARRLGDRIDAESEHLAGGYINNFVLNKAAENTLSLAATVHEPNSGRFMQVFTTEPVMLLYTGQGLNGTLKGKSGRMYQSRAGFCMETQHHSDSPNLPEFPSTVLRPGQQFNSTTIYKFSTL